MKLDLKSKLDKLKMPEKKPMAADLADEAPESADLEEGSPEEEAAEAPAEEQAELSELDQVSDDDLLAEIKKRGLMAKLDEEGAPAPDERLV